MTSSDSAAPEPEPAAAALIEFVCNICGRRNRAPHNSFQREIGNCPGCGSTVRTRSVAHMISRELFGIDIPLADFPVLKSIKGIGMSDSSDYAGLLGAKFSYQNTYFHKEPALDIAHAPESEFGSYDFLIASEVFEHVAPPAQAAFENAFRLLKPHGLFFFTVPYTLAPSAVEHFPDLHDYGVAQLGGRHVLLNRTRDGQIQVFEDLVFHGGPGETLELRVFNESELRAQFKNAGFSALELYGQNYARFGILRTEHWSLPMTARKQPFYFTKACATELMEQTIGRAKHIEEEIAAVPSRIAEYEEWVAWAMGKMAENEAQIVERTEWALTLEAQLKERTAWALKLERDVAHHVDLAKRFQAESSERTEWALNVQSEVDALRHRLARINSFAWTQAGRMLRLVRE